jgi:hypothetical protein
MTPCPAKGFGFSTGSSSLNWKVWPSLPISSYRLICEGSALVLSVARSRTSDVNEELALFPCRLFNGFFVARFPFELPMEAWDVTTSLFWSASSLIRVCKSGAVRIDLRNLMELTYA